MQFLVVLPHHQPTAFVHQLQLIYNRITLYVGWIRCASQEGGFVFDVQYICFGNALLISLSLYFSLTLKQTLHPPPFYFPSVCPFSPSPPLFLADSLAIVQQSTSLCMFSKRKPLHFLLCSQFVLIDWPLTFLDVQWIIKTPANLSTCSGDTVPDPFFPSCNR